MLVKKGIYLVSLFISWMWLGSILFNTKVLTMEIKCFIIILLFACMILGGIKSIKEKIEQIGCDWSTIDEMTGEEFECFIADLFRMQSYRTKVTALKGNGEGDYGADVILKKKRDKIGIQCKRYKDPVDLEAVQKVVGSKVHYHLTKMMVITNSSFTDDARVLADANDVELIDREGLQELKSRAGELLQDRLYITPIKHLLRLSESYIESARPLKNLELNDKIRSSLQENAIKFYEIKEGERFGAHFICELNQQKIAILYNGYGEKLDTEKVYRCIASLKYFQANQLIIINEDEKTKQATKLCKENHTLCMNYIGFKKWIKKNKKRAI